MKRSETACAIEKALVSRVKRRMHIRIVRFWRSAAGRDLRPVRVGPLRTRPLYRCRSRSVRSWYSAQGWPRSARSLTIVFFAAPVMRTVARIELPSTRQPMIWARFSAESLFHTDRYARRLRNVKPPGKVQS